MISSLEVGALFKIVDDASPALQRIASELKEVQAQIEKTKAAFTSLARTSFAGVSDRLIAMNNELKGMGDVAAGAADKMALSFDRATGLMSMSLTRVAEQMATLKAENAGLTFPTPGAGLGAVPISSRRSAASGTGLDGDETHVGGRGGLFGRLRGGVRVNDRGLRPEGSFHLPTPALGAVAAVGYGMYEEAEIEDQVARMILTGQMNTEARMTGTSLFKRIRDTLQTISSETGYSPKVVGDAMLGVERQFAGLPLDKRIQIEQTIAPFAAAEARLKETGFGESFEALVGLSHMTGTYDPLKLPELMRQFSYASLITPAGIPQFRNAISYAMPMLHAGLDMDPGSVMFLTAMMQTAGITSTKSGTWLRSFFERAEPPLGDTPADLRRLSALQDMGLVDASRHQTWMRTGSDGKTDWDKSIITLADTINKWTSKTDAATRISDLRDAFGERGGGFGALMNLPEFIGQFPRLEQAMRQFKGGSDVLGYLTDNSPVMQTNKALADFQNVLMDIGAIALPGATNALKNLDVTVKAFGNILNGDFSLKNLSDLMFGAPKADADKSWTDRVQDWLRANSPLSRLVNGTEGLPAGAPTPWGPVGRITRADLAYMQGGPMAANLTGIGAGPDAADRASSVARAARDRAADRAATPPYGDRAAASPAYAAAPAPPAPVVNVAPAPVEISATPVTLNMAGIGAIASAVINWVVRDNQQVRGPSSFDGSAHPSSVDHGIVGHH